MTEDLWSVVETDAVPTECKLGCGLVTMTLRRSGRHVGAYCPRCRAYQKWVRQKLPASERDWWDEQKAWRNERR